jgi:hypothetical protein
MSWQALLTNGRIKRHTTTLEEIYDLRDVVERDLKDTPVDLGRSAIRHGLQRRPATNENGSCLCRLSRKRYRASSDYL